MTCFVVAAGTVYACGCNEHGQCGIAPVDQSTELTDKVDPCCVYCYCTVRVCTVDELGYQNNFSVNMYVHCSDMCNTNSVWMSDFNKNLMFCQEALSQQFCALLKW